MEDLFHYHEHYQFDRIVIEEVQFQELFKDQVIKEGAKRGIYLAIQGVRPHADKTLRISKLQPHIKNGLIRFGRQDRILLDQLKYFPKADHDDGPDALEMLFSLIASSQNGPRIRRIG
jgi:predicted phage terminase large subunit-like protein